LILTGSGSNGSLQVATLGQPTTFILPDPGASSANICLSTGNCTAAGTAGGDLTGTYPNPTIASIQGSAINISTPVGGHVLVYNASNSRWENVAIGGDITITQTGLATIVNGAVTSAKILDGTIVNDDLQSGSFTNITGVGTLTGLTVQGTANINTTGTASTAIGNGSGTFSLTSTGLNVSTAGALSGVTGIITSGGYTQSGSTANTFSGATSFTAAGTALSVTNNASIGGVLAVNAITPSGSMTIGSATQDLTLQGNAVTTITVTDSGNTTALVFETPTANTTLRFPALSAGTYDICTSSGNCQGAGVTLQSAYNNSTNPEIIVDGTRGALTVRDAVTPIGGNLLEVQDNDGSVTYFAVTAAGIQTTGSIASSGNISTSAGVIQTGGTTRIDNSGNLTNIGNITGSSAITLQPAAGQALTITAHATSSWTTDSGNLTVDTTASGGTLNLGTGSQNKTVNIGTTTGTSTTNINAGTGGITILSGANVTIGTSDTTGTLLILDTKTDIGDPTGVNGAIYYNAAYGKFRCYQNNEWVDCMGMGVAEYLYGRMQAEQDTNLSANDHIKFDTIVASSGPSINLDTSTAYTNGAGASIGRVTLVGGKTYKISSVIPWVDFSTDSGYLLVGWYDLTAGARIGTGIFLNPTTRSDSRYPTGDSAEFIFSPTVTTTIELRILDSLAVAGIGGVSAYNLYPHFTIEVLSESTKVGQFQGATATTDGQMGLVPAPLAGQQGSLLVGDGSWSEGLTFLNTTADRGLRIESTDTAFIILNGDTDDDGNETGTAYIGFRTDGTGAINNVLGIVQQSGTDPTGGSVTGAASNALYLGTRGTNRLQFGVGAAVQMEITSDGWVGIGRSPAGPLDILKGEDSVYFRRTTDQYIELRTNANGNSLIGFSESGNEKYMIIGADTNSLGISFYTSSTTSSSGTLRLTIDSATGNIIVGTSDTTGTLLVLDTKTDSGDPTGVNGGMYYNSNSGKFRCYENGAWVNCISAPPDVVIFTSSGTFTKASYPGLKGVRVKLVGGGGAGGGRSASSPIGGGGGAGAYCEEFIPASSLGSSVTVTVGSGGTGVSGGTGGSGGTSSFGSFSSAGGGTGGATSSSSAAGGNGGSVSNCDINIDGQGGENGDTNGSGAGGSTPLGQGGWGRQTGSTGAGVNATQGWG
ncbi:hypothetical protein IRY61_03905, partial [Candidatus Saccharibacteria bacterium]|nr:hypothetical protein [Candidatus Saccharibacteria bacterium]